MKEETLKKRGQLKQTFKKTILIPGLTCLIIAAQSVPLFGTASNSSLAQFANDMSYTIEVQAATEAKNQDELAEKYGLDKGVTSDKKYVKTGKEGVTGDYYQTIEGYENSADLLKALKEYLGVKQLKSDKLAPSNSDGASGACSTTLTRNFCNLSKKLSSNSSRKQIAKLGAANTDWINASWEEAPELVVLNVFGIVNDDFGLIEYNSGNRNSTCRRDEFWTMYYRFDSVNVKDSVIQRIFDDDKASRDFYSKLFGKNYKKRNFVAAVANNLDYMAEGRFMYDSVNKKNMAEGITRGEVYSLIGNLASGDKVPMTTMQKKLSKAFKDISAKNFVSSETGDIYKSQIGEMETINLYLSWKAGILKPDRNGNLNLKGTMTRKEVVKTMVDAARLFGKYKGLYGK